LERLDQPLKIKTPKIIGLCFSADIFDKAFVGSYDLEQVVNKVKEASWHWFFNLTKQPQNIPPLFPFPPNWIQGVSVNTRKDLDRIRILKGTRAYHLAVSFEPLYEDLGKIDLSDIDWVIIGAQTHPLIEPKGEWVQNLIVQARQYGASVFVKNNIPYWKFKEYPEYLHSMSHVSEE
jgi:protein gp37